MKRVLRHVAGWLAIVIGIAGLFLPVLQGWLFIGIGALLLAPDVPLFARLVCWIEWRFPRLRGIIKAWRERLHHSGDGLPPCPPD